ncbi:MAG: 3-dehydroquinate synthase [Candidatus Poribacteria bacterium]|jgi:3-dehydroquinate synthase|nr:3-dehydroquinate synthase [Candidatus Poribacteria bacterium]
MKTSVNSLRIDQTVEVDLGADSYPILIGQGLIHQVGQLIADQIGGSGKVAVVADQQVTELFDHEMVDGLKSAGYAPIWVEIPGGDQNKSIEWFMQIQNALIEHQMDRQSLLIALGGGVIGDLSGFAAATFMRGINWVQVPTTLLAQVDASVGGKTAINHPKGKNLIGAFHQPKLVVIDSNTLKTLPLREIRCGLVEIIKHGVIMDLPLLEQIEQYQTELLNLETEVLTDVIAQSCRDKAWVVKNDEKEADLRSTLNYGHTFGHALETLTDYHQCQHGEAVSVGMNCAAQLSVNLGLLDQQDLQRQNQLLQAVGLPICLADLQLDGISATDLLRTMYLDKKASSDRLKLILTPALGQVVIRQDVPDDEILKAIEMCKS